MTPKIVTSSASLPSAATAAPAQRSLADRTAPAAFVLREAAAGSAVPASGAVARADRAGASPDQVRVVIGGLQRERERVLAMFQIIAEHGGRGAALTAALQARPDLIDAGMLADLQSCGLSRQWRAAAALRPELVEPAAPAGFETGADSSR